MVQASRPVSAAGAHSCRWSHSSWWPLHPWNLHQPALGSLAGAESPAVLAPGPTICLSPSGCVHFLTSNLCNTDAPLCHGDIAVPLQQPVVSLGGLP